ncbi:lipoprotein receptor [Sorangium sp. So ce1099]|uniref:lipoprotein receptor n=1 Tax=Sorangium sp. So ce1099 TaxID=3133331 RepID=UPI003F61F91E
MLSVALTGAACTTVLGDFTVGEAGAGSAGGSSGCQAGTADCDGDGVSCEVNLTSDAQNCGSCDAVCVDGGICEAGGCSGPTEIARGYPMSPWSPNAQFLAIYEDEVYWTAGEGEGGSVQKVSILGGSVTSLAMDQNAPYGIAVNQHGVFWANLNDTNIMWVDRDGAERPRVVFDSNYATLGVAADESEVFWAQRAGGIGAPGDGSSIGQITMPDGQPNDEFHEENGASPHLIALDERHVYWVDRSDHGTVNRTSRGTGDSVELAEDQPFPYAIAVDRDHVYWTNSPRAGDSDEPSAVMRIPKAGARSAMRLWTPAEDDDVANPSPDCIAVDDNDAYVYWTDQGSSRVLRKRKDGSGRQEVLYEGGTPRGIALHGEYVYWVDEKNDGAVRKLRR